MKESDRLGQGQLRAVVVSFRDGLRSHEERLNRLNVYPVPDGDTGTNMALTVESVVEALGSLPADSPMATVCKAISQGGLMGARGNSGVILSQVLRGLCGAITESSGPDGQFDGAALAGALTAASAAAYAAVMHPVEGTILTVVREAAEAAEAARVAGSADLVGILDRSVMAARQAVERTPELLPVLAEAGVVDAGGSGFVLLLDAFLHVVDGRPMPECPVGPPSDRAPSRSLPAGSAHDVAQAGRATGGPRYEVMYFLEAADDGIESFKAAWDAIGESIVVVGGDGLWNCHIHTDDIGSSIEAAVEVGRPRSIRVTDLSEQVAEEQWVRTGRRLVTGVVAVGAGDRLAEVLRALGATQVVAGGQCANPSTAEILQAVEECPADAVVVLPNNKNVVPAANQVPELATKAVVVVPTHTMVQGAAALLAYDPEASADHNAQAMAAAAAAVLAGEITRAVRDARGPAGEISDGDHLGLLGDEIVVVRRGLTDAACGLLEHMVEKTHELVTVIEGVGSSEADTEAIRQWLAENRPEASVEVADWGHPLSPYLFSVE